VNIKEYRPEILVHMTALCKLGFSKQASNQTNMPTGVRQQRIIVTPRKRIYVLYMETVVVRETGW
jgi:hypothetical protein